MKKKFNEIKKDTQHIHGKQYRSKAQKRNDEKNKQNKQNIKCIIATQYPFSPNQIFARQQQRSEA